MTGQISCHSVATVPLPGWASGLMEQTWNLIPRPRHAFLSPLMTHFPSDPNWVWEFNIQRLWYPPLVVVWHYSSFKCRILDCVTHLHFISRRWGKAINLSCTDLWRFITDKKKVTELVEKVCDKLLSAFRPILLWKFPEVPKGRSC